MHRRRAFALGLGGSALAVLCAQCRSPTQVTLLLTTDACSTGYQGTSIALGRADLGIETTAPLTVTKQCDASTGAIGSFVVTPSAGKDATFEVKVVVGIDSAPDQCAPPGYAGCIVSRRVMRFIPHTPLELPIELDISCKGIGCTSTTTCVNGGCVPAVVPDPALCDTPVACGQGVLGDAGASDAPEDATLDQSSPGPDGSVDSPSDGVTEAAPDAPVDAPVDAPGDVPNDMTDDDTGLPSDTGADAPPSDSGCPVSPLSSCVTCCDTSHAGYAQMYTAQVFGCLCSEGKCKVECGSPPDSSLCGVASPYSAACVQCAVNSSAPATDPCHGFYSMCQTMFAPECPAMLTCVEACQ